ncbi:hypothetical protein [uncultured Ligilactobacillus sp.]|uniref:hypothetical protein n=2 Tax=uncultured Ligilactobacillus sp. TaxID=2837633 RepID=UPI00272B7ECC|nr:hypothetical protein [uncultured Ligilactobacillus sp.]
MMYEREGDEIITNAVDSLEELVNMKFDLENKKHVNFVKLADDVLLQNCILEPIPQDEQPFGDNRFVKVTEDDMTYLANTDYIVWIIP